MGDIPAGFSSVLGPDRKSLVFYVNKYNIIKRWGQRNDSEIQPQDGRNTYNDVEMRVDGKPIKTTSKDLAAVIFPRNDELHVRALFPSKFPNRMLTLPP